MAMVFFLYIARILLFLLRIYENSFRFWDMNIIKKITCGIFRIVQDIEICKEYKLRKKWISL